MPDDTPTPMDKKPVTAEEPLEPNADSAEQPVDEATPKPAADDQMASLPPAEPTPESEAEPATATLKPLGSDQPASEPAQAARPSKKKWLIAAIAAAVVVVLTGVGALAYNVWYQNPDKVVGDAIAHLMSAETIAYTGTIDVRPTGQGREALEDVKSVNFRIDGKTDIKQGELNVAVDVVNLAGKTTLSLYGSGMMDNDGNLYVKVGGLAELLEEYKPDDKQIYDAVKQLVDKVDNKWIKVTADELKEVNQDVGNDMQCLQDTIKKYNQDDQLMKLVGDTYRQHRFIEIDKTLPARDNNVGYLVSVNGEKEKAFTEALKESPIYKDLEKCGYDFDADADTGFDSDKQRDVQTEVWIDRWSHQLSEIKINDTNTDTHTTVDFLPVFDGPIKLTVPTDTMSVDELKKEIQKFETAYYGSAASDYETLSQQTPKDRANRVTSEAYLYMNDHKGQPPTLQQLRDSASLGSITVSDTVPTANNPDDIYYQYCGGRQFEVQYFDPSLNKAVVSPDSTGCSGTAA